MKKPSKCMGCFKPNRGLFCHTLINDDSKVVGETWVCRKCESDFAKFKDSKGENINPHRHLEAARAAMGSDEVME